MRYFALFLMLLSLGMFTVGCKPPTASEPVEEVEEVEEVEVMTPEGETPAETPAEEATE